MSIVFALAAAVTSAPVSFPSADAAFAGAVEACEALYSGTLRGERSDPNGPGPMTRRGFVLSARGDEARVNMLMLARTGHVYKANVANGSGVVYIVLTTAPLACRAGSFDSPGGHEAALTRLTRTGWAAQVTRSSSPSARMQLFQKSIRERSAVLNISWPATARPGPNGLSAMATMVLEPAERK